MAAAQVAQNKIYKGNVPCTEGSTSVCTSLTLYAEGQLQCGRGQLTTVSISICTYLAASTNIPHNLPSLALATNGVPGHAPNKQQSYWYATLWLVVSTRHLQPRHHTDRHTYADGSADSANIASKNTCTPTNLPSTVCKVLVNHCHIVTLSVSDRIGSSIA